MAFALQLIVLLCVTTGLWIGAEACVTGGDCCKACPTGWTTFDSSCYVFHYDALDWGDAEKLCTSLGGNLASVHTKEQFLHLRSAVRQLTGRHTTIWLGGFDAVKEGDWLWSDGSPFEYVPWAEGEPNNAGGIENCMEMSYLGKESVNDVRCDPKRPFLCVIDL